MSDYMDEGAVSAEFGIFKTFKGALTVAFSSWGGLLVTALVPVAFLLVLILVVALFSSAGLDSLAALDASSANPFSTMAETTGVAFAVMAIGLFLYWFLFSALFVFWIRQAVLGDDRAWRQDVGNWLRQTFSVGVRVIFAAILIAIAAGIGTFVIGFVLLAVGLAGNFDASAGTVGVGLIVLFLIIGFVSCLIYAAFSESFVRHSLGARYRVSFMDRHQAGSIVLPFSFLLLTFYIAYSLLDGAFTAALGGIGGSVIAPIISYALFVLGIAFVGAAHGIAYKSRFGDVIGRIEDGEYTGEVLD